MRLEAASYLRSSSGSQTISKPSKQIPTIFEAIHNSSLPGLEKTIPRMAAEAFVVIAAGGDTVARALSISIFHLLSNPNCIDRLREELLGVDAIATHVPDMSILQGLSFLVGELLILWLSTRK